MKFKKVFSADIYHTRTAHKMTQPQVANHIGINLRTYQYLEKGKTMPRGDTLLKLVYWLDLDIGHYKEALEPSGCE